MAYVCKPLATGLLLALACAAPEPVSATYRALVALGLAFSLAGDVFLMLPRDRFLPGLASFGVAHLLYIAAFSSAVEAGPALGALAAWLGVAALLVPRLWRHFGGMRAPALVYVTAILAMGWRATAQWQASGEHWSLLAFAGALSFVASDTLLAWNRFRTPFRAAQLLVLGTYYPAQLLIALSVTRA
jgi:uncharacterized membrane protein YhhN